MDNDDLTASVWDDAVSPNDNSDDYSAPQSTSTLHHSIVSPLSNQFGSLAMEDPFAAPLGFRDEPEEEQEEEEEEEEDEAEITGQNEDEGYDAVGEQVRELKKEENKEHSNQLLSELTSGVDDSDILESSVVKSPERIEPSESLFNDKGASPLKISKSRGEVKSPSRPATVKATKFKATRPRKFSAKVNVQHMDESSTNPLGPLSIDTAAEAVPLSVKPTAAAPEATPTTASESIAKETEAPLYQIDKQDDSTQNKKPIHKRPEPAQEEADPHANKLEIAVGDPMKVGDITTVHIVYTIKTKNKNLESKYFPAVEATEVSRRYKDFRWIYHQLQNNHPGRIIPPPPSKQTYIGRFNESFIENRRLSLEKMLTKISSIPVLANDPDFVMFLTSEDFANESKERERVSGSGASSQNSEYLDRSEDLAVTSAAAAATGASSGFMSSLFSMSTKVTEPDQYFIAKKQYIDDLEYNLKQFYKTIELIGQQRLDMIGILEEISITMDELSGLEISKVTSDLLSAFSEVELKIKDNLDRINLQDQLTLGFTIEEYLRTIGSINFVFDTRLNVYQQLHNFSQELSKKQSQLDKLTRKQQQVDKIKQLNFEVDKLKQRTEAYDQSFKKISETIKQELENFEYERIDDFRNSVEIFIESAIEAQKEAIELYETFYERQKLGDI
ncbi:Vacuolar protein sorting-associated protein 5 [Candida viswanathii]|uniref:Vacuolar protein sorting-associated protein 5 n=1 Tax=Candida viswanathii TaxID=5486 RepID=A0A367XTE0_9ASCO|nr:Vacuolar protein sorting-associated protein 5 [Candida viswanathii]